MRRIAWNPLIEKFKVQLSVTEIQINKVSAVVAFTWKAPGVSILFILPRFEEPILKFHRSALVFWSEVDFVFEIFFEQIRMILSVLFFWYCVLRFSIRRI